MKILKTKIESKKFLALVICLDLVVFLVVGGTLAYIFTASEPVVNTFAPVTPDIEITEEFNDSVKTHVAVKNTGTVSSYIRSQVVITWQNDEGNILPVAPELGRDYTIIYGTNEYDATTDSTTDMKGEYWTKGADDFWYYNKSVAPEDSTDDLIVEAKWIEACEDPNYTLHIEILSQSVQSAPDAAVNVWDNNNVDVTGADGTLTVTSKN